MRKYRKILILGSGALKIGEAGEFDYSGSQAIKALKEEKIKTVLVNPNIATIQTSTFLADQIYFLPVTDYFVEKIIAKERPDGVLLSFGGQTALNCGVELSRKGVFRKYGVEVLGNPIQSIILTEDRQKFAEHLRRINISVPPSKAASSLSDAKKIASHIGLPVMVRAAFALGGQNSGVCRDAEVFEKTVTEALRVSPQVLIEKYLHHYKEVEYEAVRDAADNCITVCNMENMDPLGIHTGDSIVVAPSQTLNNYEYHKLRDVSIQIVRSLNIVGECNVQFALNPNPRANKLEYYVIEVNARLSRSSALASKATGYPLAYVAAKLALGKLLHQIPNKVTEVTKSFFEPAMDYVVVKIPRWDLEKFRGAEERIGTAMKSVGEIMAIGRTFEEALQKGVRMLEGNGDGLQGNGWNAAGLRKFVTVPTPKRLFAIADALRRGWKVEKLGRLTGIDPWFLCRIGNIISAEKKITRDRKLDSDNLLSLKQLGFSDKRIGNLSRHSEEEIRNLRRRFKIFPSVFQIDTLAGEVPARTNYLYLTYNGGHGDVDPLGGKSVLVLGSGPYRIGSSVEFDWSSVRAVMALAGQNIPAIVINCNPETVSTDYDVSDRLYFEELSAEAVKDIWDIERPQGIIISMGGQTPNNIAGPLARYGIKIFGTSAENIDRAEDRSKFSRLLDVLRIPQPEWNKFDNLPAAVNFAKKAGYPVLVRPSYVLSGSAMSVCYDDSELRRYLKQAAILNPEHPVTVSKFISGAKELELDAVAEKGSVRVMAISEHVENAGVHSGDATIVYPPQRVYTFTEQQITKIASDLARALSITGPFNIQFLVKDNLAYVIEINLRASRSFPFISKATGVDFSELAVLAMLGKSRLTKLKWPPYAVVKSPQFSFARLTGADPILRVEMSSTGEVACFGKDLEEALLKSIYASTPLSSSKAALLTIGGDANKERFLESARRLHAAGYTLYATGGTSKFLTASGVRNKLVYKIHEKKNPSILRLINSGEVAFVVNVSERDEDIRKFQKEIEDAYLIRRAIVEAHLPLFTDLQFARAFVKAVATYKEKDLEIKSYAEYLKEGDKIHNDETDKK